MINENENIFSNSRLNRTKCSICNSENIAIIIHKINNKKLKEILSINDKDKLIKKCNCSNYENRVHKICLLLNTIFNFEIKCRQCKCNYNIIIDKAINNSKKLGKIFSYIFMTLFHIILFACSLILVLYEFIINKDINKNITSKVYYHLPIFFGVILFIINFLLISISYSNFIDKNENDIYDYTIDLKEENEQIKIKNDSEEFYTLLQEFYIYFHGTRIKYLINQNHKNLFFAKGYRNNENDIKKIMNDNNDSIFEENNILNLNKVKNRNEINENNNINKEFHYTGTLGDLKLKKKEVKEYNKNNGYNSFEKNSKNTNPINVQLSLIKKDFEENKSHKDNMDDIFIIHNNLKSKNEKKSEKNTINSVTLNPSKKYNLMSKSGFYKKIDNKLLSKSRTYRTKSDRKKEKKENEINLELKKDPKKIIKINDSGSEKNYVDSTFLLKNENNKEKENERNKK